MNLKSLHELRDELVGVRLRATNVSLWEIGASLTEAARVALNDALRTYEFTVQRVYTSLSLPLSGTVAVVLPRDVHRIVELYAVSGSGGGSRTQLTGYDHRATAETNFIWIRAHGFQGVRNAELVYEARTLELPAEVVLAASLDTLGGSVEVTGGMPAVQWRSPGFLQVRSQRDTLAKELVRYEGVLATAFTGLQRGVGGVQIAWEAGDVISPVLEVKESALPTLMVSAQAQMYRFWIRHRALFDQIVSVAGIQQLSLTELLGLIRTEEDRADRLWKKARESPAPTHATVRGRRR